MTPVERVFAVAFATSLALHGGAAHAQSAGAEALFREGRTLIKQGKLDAGCDKLEASEKLESSVGTLLNLGDCREKQGRYATAWAAFRKAEAEAKRDGNDKKRQAEANRRALKLEGSLAQITIQVGPSSKTNGLVVKRDGETLDPAVWGTAIVVDPGNHTIVAQAPGSKPWTSEVSVGKGGKRWVVVPTLEKVPEPPKPAAPPPPAVVVAPPPSHDVAVVEAAPRTIVVERTWGPAREVAVGLAVVGAAAIGGGIYYGSRANDLESRSNAICPERLCGDLEGLRLNDQAQSAATRANIFLIGGGAAVAAATVIWFVGKPESETVIAPSIGSDHIGASLARRF
jgi:serine/threonine-protein kinase